MRGIRGELPAVETLVSLLQTCRQKKDITHAKEVYTYLRVHHLDSHSILGNHLVPLLAECGSLHDAHLVSLSLPHLNVFSWSSLIWSHVNCGDAPQAILLYHKMQEDYVQPNSHTFVALLKACSSLKCIDHGRQMHAEIIKKGLHIDLIVGSAMIDMYIKCGQCGSLPDSQWVFDSLPDQNEYTWSSLILGYTNCGELRHAFHLFQKMQENHVQPNGFTYGALLKACSRLQDVQAGCEILTDVFSKRLELDVYIGSAIVDMFGKCNLLAEANQILDKLPIQDSVPWNAMIAGYIDNGHVKEALSCYKQMQLEGVPPDDTTFICSLKAFGILGLLEAIQILHSEIVNKGLERAPFMTTTLVDVYGKCGLLVEAQHVFNELPFKDEILWNALISGYAAHGLLREALSSYRQMLQDGVSPGEDTFSCSLQSSGILGSLDVGQFLHAEIIFRGMETSLSLVTMLIGMYAKCGMFTDAHQVFDKLATQDAVSWNILIAGYAEYGLAEEGLDCFKQMQLEGVCPDFVTYPSCLKVCGIARALEIGQEIHIVIARRGWENDPCMANALIDMYGKCGSLPEAQEVFDQLQVRDHVSWTALISGYIEHGFGEEALYLLKLMRVRDMYLVDFPFACGLKACGMSGSLETGQELHGEIIKKGFERENSVANMLVDMYGKCGALLEARDVIDKMPTRDVTSWTSMINAYGENHLCKLAMQCFENMQEEGVKPNAVTFTCLLAGCSHASLVLEGQKYFKFMKEDYRIKPMPEHYACMVDLFARSGYIYEAKKLTGVVQCHPSADALRSLLSACKTHGDIELGHRCFQQLVQMKQENAAVYALMVDIYANAGKHLDECKVDEMRNYVGVKKIPGSASIEVNKRLQEFVVGGDQSKDSSTVFETFTSRMKEVDYIPNLELV